jgi:hypothetical protein
VTDHDRETATLQCWIAFMAGMVLGAARGAFPHGFAVSLVFGGIAVVVVRLIVRWVKP